MAKIRLGIDARLYGPEHSGIGRYTADLAAAIQQHLSQEIEIVAFTDGSESAERQLHKQGIRVIPAPFRVYSLAEQLWLPRILRSARCDLLHFPHYNVPLLAPTPYLVTIHDLLLHHFPSADASNLPQPLFWLKYLVYRFSMRRTLRRARAIIAVSNFTAKDIQQYYPRVASKVIVIPQADTTWNAENLELDDTDKNVSISYTNNQPFVLVVGNAYPHKNLSRLLEAWHALSNAPLLLVVGRRDKFMVRLEKKAQTLNIMGRVKFLGFVPDSQLRQLYVQALFTICPSLFEGAGLPGLEALRLGGRVVSSRAASLPELYGEAATYIPVDSAAAMAQALAPILEHGLPPQRFQPPKRPASLEVSQQLRTLYQTTLLTRKPWFAKTKQKLQSILMK